MSDITLEHLVMSKMRIEQIEEWLDVPQNFAGQDCYKALMTLVYAKALDGTEVLILKVPQFIPGKLDERAAAINAEKTALLNKVALYDAELLAIDERAAVTVITK